MRTFQEKAVLRVRDLRLSRIEAEEGSIKQISSFKNRASLDIIRIGQKRRVDSRSQQVLIGEGHDRFHSVAQIPP